MDYVIDKKDFVKHEADIVLSGCIKELLIPTMYEEEHIIYWAYSGEYARFSLWDYDDAEVYRIKNKVKNYMLRPDNIVFHPSRIAMEGGQYRYHYVPSKRLPLYHSDDLLRYLDSEEQRLVDELCSKASDCGICEESVSTVKDSSGKKQSHFLFFTKEKRLEKLLLENTRVGTSSSCSIYADCNGSLSISKGGELLVLEGEAFVNGKPIIKSRLLKGDRVQMGRSEFVYW